MKKLICVLLILGALYMVFTGGESSKLKGKWRDAYGVNVEFYSDDRVVIDDGEDSVICTYTAEKDVLQVQMGSNLWACNYEVHGDTLVLIYNGISEELRRIK